MTRKALGLQIEKEEVASEPRSSLPGPSQSTSKKIAIAEKQILPTERKVSRTFLGIGLWGIIGLVTLGILLGSGIMIFVKKKREERRIRTIKETLRNLQELKRMKRLYSFESGSPSSSSSSPLSRN